MLAAWEVNLDDDEARSRSSREGEGRERADEYHEKFAERVIQARKAQHLALDIGQRVGLAPSFDCQLRRNGATAGAGLSHTARASSSAGVSLSR